MLNSLLLINWGIGEKILEALHFDSRVHIHAVITRHGKNSNDKWMNCVYEKALPLGYDVINTRKMSFAGMKEYILVNKIDLLVVHGYKRILPPAVFSAPHMGSINIHPSLLPEYRGADPSRQVLENGESTTGISCHYIDENIDTGNILARQAIDVSPGDTRESLIDKMKPRIPALMTEAIGKVMRGEPGTPQEKIKVSRRPARAGETAGNPEE
ncbi:MAG: hypothetical protein GY765_40045 [bacterium]|nr:hypothetical protein [bacterium]